MPRSQREGDQIGEHLKLAEAVVLCVHPPPEGGTPCLNVSVALAFGRTGLGSQPLARRERFPTCPSRDIVSAFSFVNSRALPLTSSRFTCHETCAASAGRRRFRVRRPDDYQSDP